jgi:hypothetical protein
MLRRVLLALLVGPLLGLAALFPMFVNAAGHDSRSVFVDLANSILFEWPFLVAQEIAPGTASGSLGVAIHFAFYTLVAWLLLSFLRLDQATIDRHHGK